MKNDKFLIGIIAGIGLLVLAALILVLTRGQQEAYVADDTPAGVVQDYFLAIQRKDYERAYGYLSDDLKAKPDLNQFIQDIGYASNNEASLQIGDIRPGETITQVDVLITTHSGGGVFESSSYTTRQTATLRTEAKGAWRLTSFPSPYWGYNWDQPKED